MINIIKKSIINLIVIYLYLISFGGILTKFTIKNSVLFNIKQITPDFILFIILVLCIITIYLQKLSGKFKLYILIIIYFSICILLSYINIKSEYIDTVYTIRDIYLPFLTLFLLLELNLYEKYKKKINRVLIKYATIITISGFFLAIIEYINGYEWTSKFYTGHIFYGMDFNSNIMINYTINQKLRVPSITGSSVLFGFYSLISFVIILNKFKTGILKNILLLVGVSNILFSTNKTCIILCIIILYLCILRRINGYKKVIFILISLIAISGTIIYLIFYTNVFFSINDRLNSTWLNVFNGVNILSLIIPYNSFNIGSAIRDITNVKNYVDNSYIYMLITYGVIGLGLYIYTLCDITFNVKDNKIIIRQLTLIAFIAGVTISIFQGRSYFTPYCLILGLLCNFTNDVKEERDGINNI